MLLDQYGKNLKSFLKSQNVGWSLKVFEFEEMLDLSTAAATASIMAALHQFWGLGFLVIMIINDGPHHGHHDHHHGHQDHHDPHHGHHDQ